MQPIQIVGIVIGVVAVVMLLVGIITSLRGRQSVEERLQTFGATQEQDLTAKESKKRSTPVADTLNRALAGRKVSENLSTQLARADLKLTVGEFLTVQVLAALGLGVAAYFLTQSQIVLGLLAAVIGWFAPRWFVGFRQGQRLRAFNDQLGDALNLMVNGLRSGYSILQAMEAVSREMPMPLAAEFARVVQEVQIGLPLDQALANMLRRIKSDDLDLCITAINVQREVGGNLAEILDVISFTIRERVRIKGEIRTLTAQGRYSGYVISLLPICVGLMLFCINRPYIARMFTSGWCGWAMVICTLLMIATGFIAIQKIVTIEV